MSANTEDYKSAPHYIHQVLYQQILSQLHNTAYFTTAPQHCRFYHASTTLQIITWLHNTEYSTTAPQHCRFYHGSTTLQILPRRLHNTADDNDFTFLCFKLSNHPKHFGRETKINTLGKTERESKR